MRHRDAIPIDQHGLKRFFKWAFLWLGCVAAALAQMLKRTPLAHTIAHALHAKLDELEIRILQAVLLHALARDAYWSRTKKKPPPRAAPPPGFALRRGPQCGLRRAIFGRLIDRRALRTRDPAQRLAALMRLLGSAQRIAPRLLKRVTALRDGPRLTLIRAAPAILPAPPHAALRFDDSS